MLLETFYKDRTHCVQGHARTSIHEGQWTEFRVDFSHLVRDKYNEIGILLPWSKTCEL